MGQQPEINRRDFLKLMGAAGTELALSFVLPEVALAGAEKVESIRSKFTPIEFDRYGNLNLVRRSGWHSTLIQLPNRSTNYGLKRTSPEYQIDSLELLVMHWDGVGRFDLANRERTAYQEKNAFNSPSLNPPDGLAINFALDDFPISTNEPAYVGSGVLSTMPTIDAYRPYRATHVNTPLSDKTPDRTVTLFTLCNINSRLSKLCWERSFSKLDAKYGADAFLFFDYHSIACEQPGTYFSTSFPDNFPYDQQIANGVSLAHAALGLGLSPWDVVGHHELYAKDDPGDEYMFTIRFLLGAFTYTGETQFERVFRGDSPTQYFQKLKDYFITRTKSSARFQTLDNYLGFRQFLRQKNILLA